MNVIKNLPIRWRSFPIEDKAGEMFGWGPPRLEYFNGIEWEAVPQVLIRKPKSIVAVPTTGREEEIR